MAKLSVKPGSTDVTVYISVSDSSSTTGGKLTGLVWNSAGLTAYYTRTRAAATAITLATLAAVDSAHSDGGFIEVDATNAPGLYRLDLPDAAVAGYPRSVIVTLKGAANMVQVDLEIDLASEIDVKLWKGNEVTAVDTSGYPVVTIKDGTNPGELNTSNGAIVSVITVTGNVDGSVGSVVGNVGGGVAGNVGGSVASVTGNVGGGVLGAVGSVTGNVGGNVVGSVGSVTAPVTAGTVADKTGYALTVAYDPAKTAAQAGDAMTLTAAYDAAKTAATQTSVNDLPTLAEMEASNLLLRSMVATQNEVDVSALGAVKTQDAGPGAITYTDTIVGPAPDSFPIGDVDVWATTDVAGLNTVAQTKSDAFGVFTLYLDAGTYYLRFQKTDVTFTNPQQITVV